MFRSISVATGLLLVLAAAHCRAAEPARASGSQTIPHDLLGAELRDGKLLLRVPRALLDRDLLLVGRIVSGTTDPQFADVPGLGPNHGPIPWTPFANAVVRFTERPANTLVVREHKFTTSGPKEEQAEQTLAEVTIAGRTDGGELSVEGEALLQRSKLGFHGKWATDPNSVKFDRAAPFPDRLEVHATTEGKEGPIGLQWSILLLPKDAMRSRLSDNRVNFSENGPSIERWRLVKKDPAAPVSEPVDPIIVYLNSSIPARWRNQVTEGVLQWGRAFEAAGFKDALVVKSSPAGDPNGSAFDLRHAITVWWTGGLGGNCWRVSDPRSGELLNAVVTLFDGDMWDSRNEYFLHAGGADPAAAAWPVPDRILDNSVRRLAAHEVGHAFGLEHNFMSIFPSDKLRDPAWTAREGSSPTVMGYNAYNRVAQPEDHVPLEGLTPRVGAFDVFAIHWGYADVPAAVTPQEEQPTLGRWATEAQQTPWLRYTRQEGTFGDLEPWKHLPSRDDQWPAWAEEHLKRTRLYLANSRRIDQGLVEWNEQGLVGSGFIVMHATRLWSDPLEVAAKIVSSPAPARLKREAMRLLSEEAFGMPPHLYPPALVNRWGEQRIFSSLRGSVASLLNTLLNEEHRKRLTTNAATSGYGLQDLVAELNDSFCKRLRGSKVTLTPPAQMALKVYADYISALAGRHVDPQKAGFNVPKQSEAQTRAVFDRAVSDLSRAATSAVDKSADGPTRGFLQELARDLSSGRAAR